MAKRNRARKQKQTKGDAPAAGFLSTPESARRWALRIILCLTFLAFSNTLFNGFAYDDREQILQNQLIRSFSNIPTAFKTDVWFFRVQQDQDPGKDLGPSTPYYRPMFVVYLMMGWHLFGESAPFGWHLANILLHMFAVYFAFLILEKITGDLRVTAIATLLFAVHPLRSESVAWISGVTDLFLAVFILPSFYLYLRYREEGRRKWFIGSLVLYAFAAFSKEPAICLPLMIAAYELFLRADAPLATRIRFGISRAAAFLGISAIYIAARQFALGFVLADPTFTRQTYGEAALTVPLVIWKYIGLLVWPVELSLFHETPIVTSVVSFRFLLPAAALVAAGVVLARFWRSISVRFALLWFLINLLPVLNLKAFSYEFLVQERYIYIASIGFSLLVALGLAQLSVQRWVSSWVSRRTAITAVVLVFALLLTGKTLAQNAVWKNDLALWVHGVETAPDQTMSYFILGHKYIEWQRYDLAAEQFEHYLELNPTNVVVISNLAAAHLTLYQSQAATDPSTADRSHLDRAIALCERGLKISSLGPLWDTLGTTYTFETPLKNLDRAVACFDQGLRVQPDNAMMIFHMGAAVMKKGDYDRALQYLQQARDIAPQLSEVYKMLAYTQQAKGQLREAVDNLNRYLQLQPNAFDKPKVDKQIQDWTAQIKSASSQS